MSKTSASETTLGNLHAAVARTMLTQVQQTDRAVELLDEYPDMPDAVREFLEKLSTASPALLAAAAKFLKDNDITCQVEESTEMSALAKRLAQKKTNSLPDLPTDGMLM